MSLKAATSNLDASDQRATQFVAEVDAFVAGVATYTKEAGLTPAAESRMWGHIGDCVEGVVVLQQIEKTAQPGGHAKVPAAVPGTGVAPTMSALTGMSGVPGAALIPGAMNNAMAVMPGGKPNAAPAAPQTSWWQRFLGQLKDPDAMGSSLRSAIPGALGGLLMSLVSQNQRKHWLRNALIGGGLGMLAYPAMSAFAGRQPAGAGVPAPVSTMNVKPPRVLNPVVD